MRKDTMKPVIVRWYDHSVRTGAWVKERSFEAERYVVTSCGLLVPQENEEELIVLACSYHEDKGERVICGVTCIERTLINDICYLRRSTSHIAV